jgi:large subunit ribosomal protein L29
MKPAEYRGMSEEQLELTRKDVVKNIFHLRFQSATDRLETPSEIKKARRELARILTIQRERKLVKERDAAQKETEARAKAKQDAWRKMVETRRANKQKAKEAAKVAAEDKAGAKKSGGEKKKEKKKDGSAK